MTLYAVTVLGHDRPGIIADVTGALADLGGNLEDSSMTLLRGHFAWTLVVDLTDADAGDVDDRLAFLETEDLVVSVMPVPPEAPAGVAAEEYLLSVHGADRPGLVSALTRVVADVGGNITDLTTRLGTGLYVVVAEVALPATADIAALQATLAATAAELGVEASLRPAETDVL